MSSKHEPDKPHPHTDLIRSSDLPKPSPVTHHHHRDLKPKQLPLKPTFNRKAMVANIRQVRQNVKGNR